jgi:hypothetical protein
MADIFIETKDIVYAFAISKDNETVYFFKKKPKKLDTKWYEQLRRWLANIEKVAKNNDFEQISQKDFWDQWNILDGYAFNKRYPDVHFRVGKDSWRMLISS